ncbi:MAG: hypothetical protein HFF68_08050 [Oscillospiraceae bacterium]|nr:hypothetical protein [Oscillospiraceae bacterium]
MYSELVCMSLLGLLGSALVTLTAYELMQLVYKVSIIHTAKPAMEGMSSIFVVLPHPLVLTGLHRLDGLLCTALDAHAILELVRLHRGVISAHRALFGVAGTLLRVLTVLVGKGGDCFLVCCTADFAEEELCAIFLACSRNRRLLEMRFPFMFRRSDVLLTDRAVLTMLVFALNGLPAVVAVLLVGMGKKIIPPASSNRLTD